MQLSETTASINERVPAHLAWAFETCGNSTTTCPGELLEQLMVDPHCDAFGPVHHFLVGAALLTAYRNDQAAPQKYDSATLKAELVELSKRSSCVPGAACAQWGVCGAAASAGMAFAIIAENAPLKKEGWQDGQRMVANILTHIADAGSPRCCKRDSRIAIEVATSDMNEQFGCTLPLLNSSPRCATVQHNSVCLGSDCRYYPR